ncbi:MAG: prolipoprotein diacylglyceryl transferase [Anaerolineae bacterium]|nr:prolipoprotein diacylglyceryl transferase [Anaerolineae bacterium]
MLYGLLGKAFAWEVGLYPVLRLGPLAVTSYSALLSVGLLGGAAIAYLAARRRGLVATCALDAVLAAVLGGLVGARATYVAVNWNYYGDHLACALDLWGGGHIWQGGFIGGLIAVLIYCAARGVVPWPVLDALSPGAALLAVCAWLGCFLDKCAYGVETYPGQGLLWALSLELPDVYGVCSSRVAVQLMGAGWGVVALVVAALAMRRARFTGLVLPLWLALYCAGAFWLGFLRADGMLLLAGMRIDQAADLALFAIGAAIFLVGLVYNKKPAIT